MIANEDAKNLNKIQKTNTNTDLRSVYIQSE